MKSKVFDILDRERFRQNNTIELIASENFVSDDIMRAMGSEFTNKYGEGRPGARYYGGCQFVDELETYCQQKWQEVFKTEYHVNVQPHSGSQANFAAYAAVLQPGDKILAMNLNDGGHLTHGSNVNFSGKLYKSYFYTLDENGFIDYKNMEEMINKVKPKMVVVGASAYSRKIDYALVRKIIDRCTLHLTSDLPNGETYEYNYKPYFMVDMAHVAGLIAAGAHPSPFGYADIITTTTHKTLRGPRGGLIFCRPELANQIDHAVFPGSQGGPLFHIIAAKAICAEEALTLDFLEYAYRTMHCAKAMAYHLQQKGYNIVSGGTDNHMFILDLTSTGLSGKEVEEELERYNITVNKNCIPGETRKPSEASGIRIGTAAMVTKGYHEEDFIKTADRIDEIIQNLKAQKGLLTNSGSKK